jgi:hypothetical protein
LQVVGAAPLEIGGLSAYNSSTSEGSTSLDFMSKSSNSGVYPKLEDYEQILGLKIISIYLRIMSKSMSKSLDSIVGVSLKIKNKSMNISFNS